MAHRVVMVPGRGRKSLLTQAHKVRIITEEHHARVRDLKTIDLAIPMLGRLQVLTGEKASLMAQFLRKKGLSRSLPVITSETYELYNILGRQMRGEPAIFVATLIGKKALLQELRRIQRLYDSGRLEIFFR